MELLLKHLCVIRQCCVYKDVGHKHSLQIDCNSIDCRYPYSRLSISKTKNTFIVINSLWILIEQTLIIQKKDPSNCIG